MRSVPLVTVVAVVAVLLAACGGGDPTAPLSPDADDPGGDTMSGPHGAWVLVEAVPAIDVPDATRITLTVEEDDGQLRAGGTAACNSYGGTLTAGEEGTWSLAELAWTEMGCEPAFMEAESAYLDALVAVDTWQRDGDTLELTGGDVTLAFELLPEVEPASLTSTTWEVDGYLTGTGEDGAVSSGPVGLEAPTVRFEEDGTVTVTTACRTFAGEWTTSGDQVTLPRFGADETSVGACEPAAEEQERQVLDVLESTGFTATVEGQRLTLRNGEVGLSARPAG